MARKIPREELFDEEFLRRLRHLAMAGRRILTGSAGGRHRATDLGDGLEFADHREYAPGDELRYVDWNVFGRLDRLQIRLFHRHSEQQVHLLLDASGSMAVGEPSKELFAKRCCAGLAYLAWANLDHVSIAAWGGPGEGAGRELNPGRGRVGRFATILEFLANVELGGSMAPGESARRWLAGHRPRGLAVLLSDCTDLDDLGAGLRRLRHAGQQVAVLQLYSPADEGRVPGGPLAMVDPERSGRPLRVTAEASVRSAYAELWSRYLARARATVHGVSGLHAHSSTGQPWERFLLNCLRRMRLAAV